MRVFRIGEKGFDQYLSWIEMRIVQEGVRLEQGVRSILENVRKNGDQALIHYTRLFDGVKIRAERIRVRRDEIDRAYQKVPQDFLGTLKKAARRIQRFHRSVSRGRLFKQIEEDEYGIRLGQMIRPLEKVGIYVPGGKASYPSTVLMAAIPAKVAGVQRVFVTTPPRKGGIDPAILVAADLAGVDEIYRVGGVQAIGALAYGTRSIARVDKIVGPGNRYVAMAKRLVYGTVDIDMVAGPSEIVIIADDQTPASFVAADLISQAEHDEMALPILITASEAYGEEVRRELKRQLPSLKRERIAHESLTRRGAILIVKDFDQAIELANRIAPEHLEISLSNARSLVKKLRHAGALFLGPYTAEAIGDYMAGPNHILPTAGTARFSSPLGVEDFIKRTNLIRFTRNALRRFEKDVKRFAEREGLEGHYRAIQVRMKRD